MEWYYTTAENEPSGPYTLQKLHELFQSQKISINTYIFHPKNVPIWSPIHLIPELSQYMSLNDNSPSKINKKFKNIPAIKTTQETTLETIDISSVRTFTPNQSTPKKYSTRCLFPNKSAQNPIFNKEPKITQKSTQKINDLQEKYLHTCQYINVYEQSLQLLNSSCAESKEIVHFQFDQLINLLQKRKLHLLSNLDTSLSVKQSIINKQISELQNNKKDIKEVQYNCDINNSNELLSDDEKALLNIDLCEQCKNGDGLLMMNTIPDINITFCSLNKIKNVLYFVQICIILCVILYVKIDI